MAYFVILLENRNKTVIFIILFVTYSLFLKDVNFTVKSAYALKNEVVYHSLQNIILILDFKLRCQSGSSFLAQNSPVEWKPDTVVEFLKHTILR